jgi:hypothetical protein
VLREQSAHRAVAVVELLGDLTDGPSLVVQPRGVLGEVALLLGGLLVLLGFGQ